MILRKNSFVQYSEKYTDISDIYINQLERRSLTMARGGLVETLAGMILVDYLFNATGKGTGGGPLSGIRDRFDNLFGRSRGPHRYPSKARRLQAQGITMRSEKPRIYQAHRDDSLDDFDDIPGYNPYR